jgi:hypothetical protein
MVFDKNRNHDTKKKPKWSNTNRRRPRTGSYFMSNTSRSDLSSGEKGRKKMLQRAQQQRTLPPLLSQQSLLSSGLQQLRG